MYTQKWDCWIVCYIFNNLRTLHTVFHRAVPVYTFHHQCLPVPSSPPPSAFISGLLDNRHSNRCEVTSCGLICLSMMCSDVEHISSSTCWPFVHLLWKNICFSSLPISKLDYLQHRVRTCSEPSGLLSLCLVSKARRVTCVQKVARATSALREGRSLCCLLCFSAQPSSREDSRVLALLFQLREKPTLAPSSPFENHECK